MSQGPHYTTLTQGAKVNKNQHNQDNIHSTCWVVTDGKAGMENQCLGLAAALGLTPVVKRTRLRMPWQQLSPFLRLGFRYAFSRRGDSVGPPWPDVLIATGRASIPASLYARRATMRNGVSRTFTVQLQNPVIDPSRFDLVVVPRHDGLTGPNVITTRGALHRVTPEILKADAAKLLPQVAHLPSPRIAVLIGGSNAVYQLTAREMRPLTAQLAQLTRKTGGSLMITPSRRTGAENLAILQEGLKDLPVFIWNGQGGNPYYGLLGLADYVIVTCDSVNMVSEACTTGKPVYVVDLPGGSEKFHRFHQSMRDDGLTRAFTGELEQWSYPPLDDMRFVAERVAEELRRRMK
jgi:mitochondrial fission protein ELM1